MRASSASLGVLRFLEKGSLPIAMAVLFACALLVYLDGKSYSESREANRRARNILADVQGILSAITDAETGQRGFLLTGRDRYLEPYQAALPRIERLLAALKDKAVVRPENQAAAERLQTLVREKLAELKQTISLRKRDGFDPALAIVEDDRGVRLMENIRGVCDQLGSRATQGSLLSEAAAEASANKLRIFALVGSAVLFALLALANTTIGRGRAAREALIDDLHRSRQEVERARDLLQTTLSSIGDAVIATDRDGRITFMNPVAQNLTAWREEDARTLPLESIFRIENETTREAVENPVEKVLRTGTVVGLANHTILISKEGKDIWIDDSAAPIRDSQQNIVGVVLVFRDVTERRGAERELEAGRTRLEYVNRALQDSNEYLEHFAYGVSHDLQEPLRTIASFSELLARKTPEDADTKQYVGFVQEGTTRMQNLIRDLLEYSRLAHVPVHENEVVDTNKALEEALSNLQASIRESGANITHEILPDVMGKHSQLTLLFQNLIGNALKYRGTDAPRVHIGAEPRDGDECLIYVRDNGIGIDMKYAEEIFGLFKRLHTHAEYEGTGMGLALCKRVVELHRGRIWVTSKPGAGSTFWFTLPLAAGKTVSTSEDNNLSIVRS